MKRTLMAFLLLGGLALAQADGAKIYAQCAGCHQQNGQGIPGAFPPLAGHVAEILAKEGGREYLILVLLYGLQGQIEVKGVKYNLVMPPSPSSRTRRSPPSSTTSPPPGATPRRSRASSPSPPRR